MPLEMFLHNLLNVLAQIANKMGLQKKSISLSLVAMLKSGILATTSSTAFFLDFPIYLQSVKIHSDTFCKWCVGKRGRVEECSVTPLCNESVKNQRV
jgi:hypothetical protein